MTTPRKTILISGGVTTHPLTEHLISKGFDVAILEPNIAEAHSSKHGERVTPVGRMIDQALQNAAINTAAQTSARALARGVPAIAGAIEQANGWEAYRGNGLGRDMETWFPAHLYNSAARQVAQIMALDKLNAQKPIALVVTHEDVTEMFGGLAAWGKARGIRTLHVPHANHFMQPDFGDDLHRHSICDMIAATPHQERFYRANGYTGEIHVTGSPLFDKWATQTRDREWAVRMLKLEHPERSGAESKGKPIIVYSTSWEQMTNAVQAPGRLERAYEAALGAVKGTDWQLIVTFHPGVPQGAEQYFGGRAEAAGVRCVMVRGLFELLLQAADVFVKPEPSNALVDAAMMGVPGIAMFTPGFRVNHPAVRECEADADSLRLEIEFVLSDVARENKLRFRDDFIATMAGAADGKAAQRVSEWIGEIVG